MKARPHSCGGVPLWVTSIRNVLLFSGANGPLDNYWIGSLEINYYSDRSSCHNHNMARILCMWSPALALALPSPTPICP